MLSCPLLGEEGELLFALRLVLVDEDLDDVGVRHQLGHDQTGRGLVGAGLVDGFCPRHPEGHHQVAAPLFNQYLGGDRQVLDAGDGVPHDLGGAAPFQLFDGGSRHVVSGEVCVGDPDLHVRKKVLWVFKAYRRTGPFRFVSFLSPGSIPSITDPAPFGTCLCPLISQVENLVPAPVPVGCGPLAPELVGEGEDLENVLDRRPVGQVHGLGDSVVGELLEGRLDPDVLLWRDLHRRDEQVPQVLWNALDALEGPLPCDLSHQRLAAYAPLLCHPLE